MYLKRLEIHGFKSFAQKTVLEFAPGIIAIVGPNGSGKSNVADAMRWVLGEQSPKIIRGKKSDDVIFAGSDKKTRLGFAEVYATFDNSDHRIPVDSAEVSIGRRVDRSGESEYLLNGNKVRLLDIVDLVLKSNIGTSRYTVIGQGTIDQMVLAGPSEVKNLLDEASGVKNYQIKREKTLRRLEQTAQNLMRAEDLIAEIEPRLKSLRRQAKRMEARAEIEQELKIYQREFFGATFWTLKKSLDELSGKLEGILVQKRVAEGKASMLRKQAEHLEHKASGHSELQNRLQTDLTALQEQKNKLLEDLSLVRGKMQNQKTSAVGDSQTLQVEVHNRQQKLDELTAKIGQAQTDKDKFEQDFLARFKALEALNVQLSELTSKFNNPTQIDWPAVSRQLLELELSWEQFYRQLGQTQEVAEILHQAEQVQSGFLKFKNVAKAALHDPESASQNLKQELENLLAAKDKLNKEVNGLQLQMNTAKVSLDLLRKDYSNLKQEKLHWDLELKKAQSATPDEFWGSLVAEENKIGKEVNALGQQIGKVQHDLSAFYKEEEQRQQRLRQAEGEYRQLQDQLSGIKDHEAAVSVDKAKLDTQMEVLAEEVRRILGQAEWEALRQQQPQGRTADLENKILRLKNQLDAIGGMDELTLKEYQETEQRYTNLTGQVNDLKQGMADLRQIIDELDASIKEKFNESFNRINEKFEYYFRVLFNGGRAYLSALRQEEPAEEGIGETEADEVNVTGPSLRPEEKILQKYERGSSHVVGIDIKATPPGKKLASIQALSGGERALTSIALLCSLLYCFPSPFVVLDEVDAALDDANTIRFGQILGTLAHQTQFLTITHNRETMAQAHMLYGVTMGDDGVSKLLSVKLEQAKAFAK